MPDPQVKERVMDVPARGLRAIFAGIGSLLGVTDKMRNKPAATETVPEPPANVTVVKPATATPETATPETATPETVTPETVTPEDSVAPETVESPVAAAPAASGDAAALPLANYDELTVASLRARLRNLSPEQLTQLIDYEKGHAGRADVITMFERRIAKLAAEA
jgi:hypothetical protein